MSGRVGKRKCLTQAKIAIPGEVKRANVGVARMCEPPPACDPGAADAKMLLGRISDIFEEEKKRISKDRRTEIMSLIEGLVMSIAD